MHGTFDKCMEPNVLETAVLISAFSCTVVIHSDRCHLAVLQDIIVLLCQQADSAASACRKGGIHRFFTLSGDTSTVPGQLVCWHKKIQIKRIVTYMCV